MITEALLHYLWKNRIYLSGDLKTTTGDSIRIIHPGFSHQNAGPDFKQAVIKINDITWAGDVEIHINSNDWTKHGHQYDDKYQSVILHVVYNHNSDIKRNTGELYPTLELKNRIKTEYIERYTKLLNSTDELLCKSQLPSIDNLYFISALSRFAAERVASKENNVLQILNQCAQDWNETLYRLLLMGFGFKTNVVAFEMLGKSLSYKHLLKHIQSRKQIYALLFGQSGFLDNDNESDYYLALQSEYLYLRRKYRLQPIPNRCWNLLRLRPGNFPCIRLAQVAEVIYRSPDLFHKILSTSNLDLFYSLFQFETEAFWHHHYTFDSISNKHTTRLSKSTINLLIINTIIPFLYAYGTYMGDYDLQERVYNWLESLPFEENHITKEYRKKHFPAENAMQSQAILQLQKEYCQKKGCLECAIGQKILNKE